MKLRTTTNDYGVLVTEYKCDICNSLYTVCPSPEDDDKWQTCLAKTCDSYDPTRDTDWMFSSEDNKVTPIRTPYRKDG